MEKNLKTLTIIFFLFFCLTIFGTANVQADMTVYDDEGQMLGIFL